MVVVAVVAGVGLLVIIIGVREENEWLGERDVTLQHAGGGGVAGWESVVKRVAIRALVPKISEVVGSQRVKTNGSGCG